MEQPRRVPVPADEGGLPTYAKDVPAEIDEEGSEADSEPECSCPRLDADDWDHAESDWSDITFLKAATKAVLGVPVGYDTSKKELVAKAAKLGLTVPDDAMLLLGAGRFRRSIMLEVEGAAPSTKGVERPGGIAFSRLVPAPWGSMQTVVDATRDLATDEYGRKPDEVWVWYLTCRICSAARSFETLIVAHYTKNPKTG
jgi:hypothetical protein